MARRSDDRVPPQVGVRGRGARQPHGLVGERDVGQVGVGVGEHGDGGDAQVVGGAEHAGGDLPPVGDQQLPDHAHIRKTPKPRRARDGAGVDGRERDAQHGAGVARVDDPVVVEPGGDGERVGLGLDLRLDRGGARPSASSSNGLPCAAADALPTIDSTPASCAAPMTASFAPGQANINRGS